ncbi:lytic transglycosylase domain-containing protein [Ramlibacter sp. RBP-2]|uniref:Lytic transglycosylase domain-containing protein n=1 Tax=Ramlibacter lithotrophicus TaxID=2606681 RepID=A0A7X6DG74_9BURK|nr:lytic transglycosylase domain-containing protein [Ramlibacter lithotrophicus]NKE66574.1 lytic transglycosylase domain-containing protein [Ramlibacter lithotrophicus]
MMLRKILTLILALLVSGAQAQVRGGDEQILEMQQAFRQGNKGKLAQLLPQVRGHVLEPWAAYWELRSRLESASSAEIQEFLTRYAGTYQEDRLRNDWLLLLGQVRDWNTFAAEYPKYRMKDDREVRCYGLYATQLRGGAPAPGVAEEVRRLWLSQRDADDGCTFAMSQLVQAPGPHRQAVQDVWIKARMAVDANRPRAAAAAVELAAPDALPQLAELNASPARYLASRVFAASRARKEMVVLALLRMAASDLDVAATQLESKWGPQLSPEERNWVWGAIARRAAQRVGTGADALAFYAKVTRDQDLSDDMLAWKARAALRASRGPEWRQLLAAINAMSEEARREPAWVYWRGRALQAQGGDERLAQARELWQSIASVRGFYEQLSLEELGNKVTVPARPEPPTAQEKEAARQHPGLARAMHAIGIGLRSEGVREWNYSTNLATPGGMGERELLAAAQLACEREVWDRCINTSERTATAFDAEQRFPMPHRDAVVRRSQEIGLDAAYVYGLIRQESRFITDARSHVGASGLMQVMPATARWTARKIGMANFTTDKLNDRDTNIAIGTGYLKLVLDDFGGSMPLAAAAYNAGPGRSRTWRNGPVMDAAAWAENVPFTETRDYVKKVLANTTMYAAILTGQPQSLKARLGSVGPRDARLPEINTDLP